ncbi:hypothetical protein [Acetobacter sp. DsW_059]|uniref:hypothetical protein n=1 Tax=Acetobacter sp. DsW_059 TaxID=1670661 RepID=UPI000A3A1A5A|nr:hypothetical protein [Acetobacter sp. DsW_059]OUJ09176.1 hypothetical protein HK25_12100 [Acetobacter sp. DsW_059]
MASNKIRTAQAGLAYVTWQLARRDWAVLPASGTKKAATLIQIKKDDYHPPLLVQSRAFSGQNAVSLGENITGPDQLPFDWMAITINVRSDTPACFLLNRQDVIERMKKDPGGPCYWVDPPRYIDQKYKERWDEINEDNP